MCGTKNYRRAGRTFVESKCRNEVIETGNSNLEG